MIRQIIEIRALRCHNVTIMNSLSTQSYKGSRDYFPEDKRLQNYIFNIWRKTVESFGYEEYGAPLLEPLDIYLAKSGQELAGEQTYAFQNGSDQAGDDAVNLADGSSEAAGNANASTAVFNRQFYALRAAAAGQRTRVLAIKRRFVRRGRRHSRRRNY